LLLWGSESFRSPCVRISPSLFSTKAGGAYASWTLSDEYGFTDIDGGRPHWGRFMLGRTHEILDRGGPKNPDEQFWIKAVYSQFKRDARYTDVKARIDAVVGPPSSNYDPRAV
jgi:hypothetical protein